MSDLRTDIATLIANADGVGGPVGVDFNMADAILAEYYVISRIPLPRSERPVCSACGTWVCDVCGFRRLGASRFVQQDCKLPCTSTQGTFLDTRHSDWKYRDHLESLEMFKTSKNQIIL